MNSGSTESAIAFTSYAPTDPIARLDRILAERAEANVAEAIASGRWSPGQEDNLRAKRAHERRKAREAAERAELIAQVEASRTRFGCVELVIEVRTISGNRLMQESWMSRKGRRQRERKAVRDALARAFKNGALAFPHLPCIVTIRRHGPADIDSDGLPYCAKTVRDELSVLIAGGDDSDRGQVHWVYEQARIWEKCRVRVKGGNTRPGLRTYILVTVEAFVERAPPRAPAACDGAIAACREPFGCAVVAGWTKIRRRREKQVHP